MLGTFIARIQPLNLTYALSLISEMVEPSRQSSKRRLEQKDHEQVTRNLQRSFPERQFRLSVRTVGDGPIVEGWKQSFTYLSLAGRMFHANSQNGIVAAHVTQGNQESVERRGELLELFSHTHWAEGQSVEIYFAKVRWYVNIAQEDISLRPFRIWRYDA